MEPLVWDGTANHIAFTIDTSPIDKNRDIEKESLTYSLKMARLGKGSTYRIEHEILGNFYRVRIGDRVGWKDIHSGLFSALENSRGDSKRHNPKKASSRPGGIQNEVRVVC